MTTVLSEFCISFLITVNLLLWGAARLARTPRGDSRLLLSLQNTSGLRVYSLIAGRYVIIIISIYNTALTFKQGVNGIAEMYKW